MTLRDALKEWLEANGYEGLCHVDTECGCSFDDFMACGDPSEYCEAAHKGPPPPEGCEYDYWMYPGPRPEGGDEG